MTYEVADVFSTYVYRKGLLESNYSYGAVGLFEAVVAMILRCPPTTSASGWEVADYGKQQTLQPSEYLVVWHHQYADSDMPCHYYRVPVYITAVSLSATSEVVQGNITLFPKGFNLDAYAQVLNDDRVPRAYLNTIFIPRSVRPLTSLRP